MKTRCWQVAYWLATFLASVSTVCAQPGPPHIGYVYPAGGQRGKTLRITVGGQYVNDATVARFSGQGIQAKVLGEIKRPPMEEASQMRDKLRELMAVVPRDDAKEREIAEIQRKLYRGIVLEARRTTPAISECVLLELALAPDAELGRRELRLETPRGLSNRLAFRVGGSPEYCEREPEPVAEPKDARSPLGATPKPQTLDVALPAVLNGQIIAREPNQPSWVPERFTPGDADRYRFQARRGQQLVAVVSARELLPYLPDAVPGWFQAVLALYDADGRLLASNDDYRFHPDPVLAYKIPADGQYVIEIRDAIYRGRPDFVYRIAIGELPFITSVFPLGGRAGQRTPVELRGWNLPVDTLTVDPQDRTSGTCPIAVREGDTVSNTLPFGVDTLPEGLEVEPNNLPSAAQPLAPATTLNGRIDPPGDWDVFRWEGRAGQRIILEVHARRLDSPLDSVLELTDAAGKRLAFNDDHEDRADAWNTHHADSYLDFTAPADGTYYVRLGDAQREGGPEYAYRLRLSPPRPDFALRVTPSAVSVRPRQFVPLTVHALRTDGFAGDIALSLPDGPEDFALGGAVVPAGQNQVRVTLLVPAATPGNTVRLRIAGRARIEGREVVHSATPADDMMQAFAYTHLVPAEDLNVFVWEWSRPQPKPAASGNPPRTPVAPRRPFQSPMMVLGDPPVKIPAGGTVEVRVVMPTGSADPVQVELSDPPGGVSVDAVSRFDKGLTITLRSDATKAQPGLRGNLIASASQQRTQTDKEGKKREYRSVLGTLPAIPFEIVPP